MQNQFATEQDYLDLFDNNQVTPAMAKAYVPTNDTTGIKSITNTAPTIINETGGDGPPGAPPGAIDPGITSDDYGFGVDDPTGMGYELTDKDKSDISGQKTKNTAMGLMAALGFALNPIGFFIGRYAKDKYKEYKEKKDKDLQDQIDRENEAAANRARVEAYTGRSMSAYRQSRPRSEQGFTGHGKSGMGRDPDDKMAKGGFVRGSYFKGGIVSLRRR